MASEANVATAALAIAISALVIAAGQLVAQLFSTADGYRRCQPSVIGRWYKLVELPFRWSSFRYEVKVTTPHFQIRTMSDCDHRESFLLDPDKPLPEFPWSLFRQKSRYLVSSWVPAPLLGTVSSVRGTFCGGPTSGLAFRASAWVTIAGDDVPTWMSLLEDIHKFQQQRIYYRKSLLSKISWPDTFAPICISRKGRSWDFMPPDIVRPVASTTVGSLIAIVHRLGMSWAEFRLDEGRLRAIGDGRTFSTSIVRGMGLVVEYSATGRHSLGSNRDLIPSIAADKLACGSLPCADKGFSDIYLRLPRLPYPCVDVNLSFVNIDDPNVNTALSSSLTQENPAHRLPAYTDLLGLWCEWLPVGDIPQKTFLNPFPFPMTTMGERPESRNVWRLLLQTEENTLSSPRKQVLQFYDGWEQLASKNFGHSYGEPPPRAFFKKAFDETTAYLQDTLGPSLTYFHGQLVGCHVSVNASSGQQAEKIVAAGHGKIRVEDLLPEYIHKDQIFVERACIYVENIPKFVQEAERRAAMRLFTPSKSVSYEDVWWMMMMRLHAWTSSVQWVEPRDGGIRISSDYYDHPARVYIL